MDVIYLDAQSRVIHLIENLGPLHVPRIFWNCGSVLQLPPRSIFGSGTQVGDQLMIASPDELKRHWESENRHGKSAGQGWETMLRGRLGEGPEWNFDASSAEA
jgi:hypothetical protein